MSANRIFHKTPNATDGYFAPIHSMTSSASAISLSGTVRPSALAVLRLTTISNLVGCMTGRSLGLAPLSRRPA